jgi:predicted nucleic acid-binding protein
MRYWDSSALVPLLAQDAATDRMQTVYGEDPTMIVWWGSPVECLSALARLEREAKLDAVSIAKAARRLKQMQRLWQEVQPLEMLRDLALRLLRVHPLRAADALQLAAAIIASEHRPSTMDFVCLDSRLALAAQREGFTVIGM